MIPITQLTGRLGNQMFQFAYLLAEVYKGNIPDVYVQDERYFELITEDIKAVYRQGIGQPLPYVSIHVRRGDYVNNAYYVDLFKDGYYQKAMAEFPDATFLVFSDDIPWCEQQEVFKGCQFSKGHGEVADMNLMAACSGHIIANSSFSWWAAYLSGNKTIAPLKWFTEEDKTMMLPDLWKRV